MTFLISRKYIISWLANISIFIYLAFGFYGLYLGNTKALSLAAFVGVTSLTLNTFIFFLKRSSISRGTQLLALIFTINMAGFLFSCLYYNKFDSGFFAFIIASIGIAHLFVTTTISYRMICLIFYLVSAYFLVFIALGIDANFALAFGEAAQSSRNGVSVIMINLCALVYMVGEKQSQKTLLSPAVLTFIICTWTYGRSGIIVSLLILTGVFFKDITKKRLVFAFFIIMVLVLFVDWESIEIFSYFERLQNLRDSDRQSFIHEYLSRIDLETFLFGFYLRTSGLFNDNTNPHNSFVYLHSLTGIYALFLLSLTAIALVRGVLKNWFYSLLLVAVLLRAATDSVLFFDFYDFLLYSLVTLAFTVDKANQDKTSGTHVKQTECRRYIDAHNICN